jgi:hypothetical protein
MISSFNRGTRGVTSSEEEVNAEIEATRAECFRLASAGEWVVGDPCRFSSAVSDDGGFNWRAGAPLWVFSEPEYSLTYSERRTRGAFAGTSFCIEGVLLDEAGNFPVVVFDNTTGDVHHYVVGNRRNYFMENGHA